MKRDISAVPKLIREPLADYRIWFHYEDEAAAALPTRARDPE
jgi:hypothetical protein